MFGQRGAIVAVALLLGSSASAQTAAPLAPAGKWALEYHPSMCVLSRNFGSGDDTVTVAFRPWAMGDSAEIVVVSDRGGRGRGFATVALDTAPTPEKTPYIAVRHPERKQRFDTMVVPRAVLDRMTAAKTLSIRVGSEPPVIVPTAGSAPALKRLEACEEDLLKSWGVADAKLPVGATPASVGNSPAAWITQDDYPPESIRKEQSGTSTILWTIDTAGKVRGCRVVQSSGFPLLDQAGCTAITARGRYRPAHTADGRPIPSVSTRRIVWRLPGQF